jgi:hypothetical protein
MTTNGTRIWGNRSCFNIAGTDLNDQKRVEKELEKPKEMYPEEKFDFKEDNALGPLWSFTWRQTNARPEDGPTYLNTYTYFRNFVVKELGGRSVVIAERGTSGVITIVPGAFRA